MSLGYAIKTVKTTSGIVYTFLCGVYYTSQTVSDVEYRIGTILAHFLSHRSVLTFFPVATHGRRYQTLQTCSTAAGQRISDCLFHRECHFEPLKEQSLFCESIYTLTEKTPPDHWSVVNEFKCSSVSLPATMKNIYVSSKSLNASVRTMLVLRLPK